MAKRIIWAAVFIIIAALLESTILRRLAVFHAVPDLALGILVYSAYINGTMTGQVLGFFSGFLLDFLSAAPLGLNALIRTLIGALAGTLKGAFFLDRIFIPMFLCAGATMIKALSLLGLHKLLAGPVPSYSFFSPILWVEFALNTFSAPILFGFLKLFESLFAGRRGS
ncbi:MAG: rod shape-determining protein MreD [Treponema sp.]|jgi:rod shape-determining protein MreD|nr:rod shape-determining protein MreD [Treponema sp.]